MSLPHILDLLHSHATYLSSILDSASLITYRGVLFRSHGIPSLQLTAAFLFTFILLLHSTLPSRSPSISITRFFCFPLVLTVLWPYILDRGELVTFGNDFRDVAVLGLLWVPLSEAFRVCVVSIWDEEYLRAPRWIVPASEMWKWEDAVLLDAEAMEIGIDGGKDRQAQDDTGVKEDAGHAPVNGVSVESHSNVTTIDVKAKQTTDLHGIPQHWAIVPHPPPFTLLRLLWAIDNLTLRRPGTSWLFPSHQRALEWSHSILVKSSRLRNTRTGPVWFGHCEGGPVVSLVQCAGLVAYSRYVVSLNLSIQRGTYIPRDFFQLPLITQVILTFGVGALVVLPLSSFEWVLYHTFKHVLKLPTTAICPAFQRPLFATGPTDFWNRRWHQFLRRDFSTIARIFPGAREVSTVRFIATFVVSAAEHSFVFSRYLPRPPTFFHAIWIFFQPAFHIFFLSQAALILIERRVFGNTTESKTFGSALARRALLWVGILTSGRHLVAYLWTLGCFDVVEFTNWSESARLATEVWQDIMG